MGNKISTLCGSYGSYCKNGAKEESECQLEKIDQIIPENQIDKLIKIQSSYRSTKLKENIKLNESSLMKEFDQNLSNFGTYVAEEEIEHYINKDVKALDDKLAPFIPNPNELEIFKHVFERGPILFQNNTIYKGSWSYLGKRQGYGIYIDYDGLKYSGFWLDDKMHGRGRLIFDKTDYFEGQWKDGFANGQGMLVTSTDKYLGNWVNSVQEGYGEEEYLDGDIYKGTFKNGLKSGFGKFIWADGTYYEGNFENDLLSGRGSLQWRDGRSYDGEWLNNKMHGHGTFTWPGGKSYVGEYRNDKKEGHGTYYWNEGKYYSGHWNNNKQHGEGIFHLKGSSFEVMYRFGKLISTTSNEKKEVGTNNVQAIEKNICEGIMAPLEENININIHTDSGKNNMEKVMLEESNRKEKIETRKKQ